MAKGSALEPIPGYVRLDDARAAFLAEVNSALEKTTAFDELEKLAQREPEGDLDAIQTWARKWGVNAPCMRHAAKGIVDATRLDPADSGWRRVFRGGVVLEAWLHQLAVWNQLPVSMSADDGIASGTMNVPSERDPRARKVVPAPFERLLEQDHILAPIATTGSEPLNQFLKRARHHWKGRVQGGIRHGLTHVVSTPDLARHLGWLVRYQLDKTPFAEIAREAKTTTDAVRKAVQRLAKQLDLQLRPAPRGRPHCSRR